MATNEIDGLAVGSLQLAVGSTPLTGSSIPLDPDVSACSAERTITVTATASSATYMSMAVLEGEQATDCTLLCAAYSYNSFYQLDH